MNFLLSFLLTLYYTTMGDTMEEAERKITNRRFSVYKL